MPIPTVYVSDDDIDSSGLTEWERDHEKEEFARAAHMYKPLSNLMASRFTRGKYDEDDKVDVPAETGVRHSQNSPF